MQAERIVSLSFIMWSIVIRIVHRRYLRKVADKRRMETHMSMLLRTGEVFFPARLRIMSLVQTMSDLAPFALCIQAASNQLPIMTKAFLSAKLGVTRNDVLYPPLMEKDDTEDDILHYEGMVNMYHRTANNIVEILLDLPEVGMWIIHEFGISKAMLLDACNLQAIFRSASVTTLSKVVSTLGVTYDDLLVGGESCLDCIMYNYDNRVLTYATKQFDFLHNLPKEKSKGMFMNMTQRWERRQLPKLAKFVAAMEISKSDIIEWTCVLFRRIDYLCRLYERCKITIGDVFARASTGIDFLKHLEEHGSPNMCYTILKTLSANWNHFDAERCIQNSGLSFSHTESCAMTALFAAAKCKAKIWKQTLKLRELQPKSKERIDEWRKDEETKKRRRSADKDTHIL